MKLKGMEVEFLSHNNKISSRVEDEIFLDELSISFQYFFESFLGR